MLWREAEFIAQMVSAVLLIAPNVVSGKVWHERETLILLVVFVLKKIFFLTDFTIGRIFFFFGGGGGGR